MKIPELTPIAGWVGDRVVDAKSILRRFTGEQIALLGDEKVGKTTLITFMTSGQLPVMEKRTLDIERVDKKFLLEIDGTFKGKKTRFIVSQDLPGNDNGTFPLWRPAAFEANRVWYLFRVDQVLAGDAKKIELIKDHIMYLKYWQEKDLTPPSFTLIGTGADRVSGWSHRNESGVRTAIEESFIKTQAVKLGNAPILIGSLKTAASAKRLVDSISKEI